MNHIIWTWLALFRVRRDLFPQNRVKVTGNRRRTHPQPALLPSGLFISFSSLNLYWPFFVCCLFLFFAVWWTTSLRLRTRSTWRRWRTPPTLTAANANWSSANPSAYKGKTWKWPATAQPNIYILHLQKQKTLQHQRRRLFFTSLTTRRWLKEIIYLSMTHDPMISTTILFIYCELSRPERLSHDTFTLPIWT